VDSNRAAFACWYFDNGRLGTVDFYGNFRLFDLTTGAITCRVPPTAIQGLLYTAIGVAPAGRTFVLAGEDGVVHVVDSATGSAQKSWRAHEAAVHAVALSRNGSRLVTRAIDDTVRIWDVAKASELCRIAAPASAQSGRRRHCVDSVDISPDGKVVAWIGYETDLSIHLCDAANGREIRRLRGHEQAIQRVAFSPDGRLLASTGNRSRVRLWETSAGRLVRQLGNDDGTDTLHAVFSPNGRYVATTGFNTPVRIVDVETGKEVCSVADGPQCNHQIAFAPDSKTLAVLRGQRDPTIYRYDALTGKEVNAPPGHRGPVDRVCFSHDGRSLITSAGHHVLRKWSAATGEPQPFHAAASGTILAVSGDASSMLTVNQERIQCLDASSGRERWRIPIQAAGPYTAAFSADGRFIAITSPDNAKGLFSTLMLRNAETGKELWRLAGSFDAVLAFDGNSILCSSRDGPVLWRLDAANGSRRGSLFLPGRLDLRGPLSADGKVLASRDARLLALQLVELATGKVRLHLEAGASWEAGDSVDAVAFSPDGRYLVTGHFSGRLRIWDARTGARLKECTGHTGEVLSIAFDARGERMATASADTTALVWDWQKLLADQ
jgi:WD40 repeat protein